jgi:hypothetical protein
VFIAWQSFSSWTFSQIKTLFELTADNYIDLPRFNGESTDTTDYKKVLEHVLEDIAIKLKTCIHITRANEATWHKFISSVLHGVASCYDGEVKARNAPIMRPCVYGIVLTGVDWVIILSWSLLVIAMTMIIMEISMYYWVNKHHLIFPLMRVCSSEVLCLKNSRICLGKSSGYWRSNHRNHWSG